MHHPAPSLSLCDRSSPGHHCCLVQPLAWVSQWPRRHRSCQSRLRHQWYFSSEFPPCRALTIPWGQPSFQQQEIRLFQNRSQIYFIKMTTNPESIPFFSLLEARLFLILLFLYFILMLSPSLLSSPMIKSTIPPKSDLKYSIFIWNEI